MQTSKPITTILIVVLFAITVVPARTQQRATPFNQTIAQDALSITDDAGSNQDICCRHAISRFLCRIPRDPITGKAE